MTKFRSQPKFFKHTVLPILCVSASTIITARLAPVAAGSGIPQIKTLLRGFEAENYLSMLTMVVKIVGLTFALGSRLPLGKEGPFIHIACCLAMNIGKHVFGRTDYLSEEVLSAACAVGIACNFAAPIGGVLFAIEVTTNYFAVRNYSLVNEMNKMLKCGVVCYTKLNRRLFTIIIDIFVNDRKPVFQSKINHGHL